MISSFSVKEQLAKKKSDARDRFFFVQRKAYRFLKLDL